MVKTEQPPPPHHHHQHHHHHTHTQRLIRHNGTGSNNSPNGNELKKYTTPRLSLPVLADFWRKKTKPLFLRGLYYQWNLRGCFPMPDGTGLI